MPCRPMFCDGARDCNDLHCPGHGLRQEDGGARISDGLSFPIEDDPVITPESATWTAYLAFALLVIASACAAFSYIAFFHA